MMRRCRGFVLLPMLLLLVMVAGLVMWTQREASLQTAGLGHEVALSRAKLVAEAGLQHMASQMRSAGCAGRYRTKDNPLGGPDMGGFSYTSYADVDAGSPVTLSSTGSDGQVSVTVVRNNVTPVRGAVDLVILQPDSAGQDTTLDLANSGLLDQGSADRLTLQSEQQLGLLKFDASTNLVPPGSTITSATLVMRALSGSGSGNVGLYRVQSAWTEAATASTRDGNVPWVVQSGDAHEQPVSTLSYAGGPWLRWDVTDLVDRWVKGGLPNQGLLIKADAGLTGLTLASSDHSAPGLRPRLELKLHGPCGWNAPKQTVVFNASSDATLLETSVNANTGDATTLTLAKTVAAGKESRAVLQFELDALIGSTRRVKSATLRIYLTQTGSGTPLASDAVLGVRQLWSTWQEASVTWKNRDSNTNWIMQGGDQIATPQDSLTIAQGSSGAVWVEFDLTSLVAYWRAQSFVNNGVVIAMDGRHADSLIFVSRESTSTPPELVVEYE